MSKTITDMIMLNTAINDLNEITNFNTELRFADESIKIIIDGTDAEICYSVKRVIAVLRGMKICTIAQAEVLKKRSNKTASKTSNTRC